MGQAAEKIISTEELRHRLSSEQDEILEVVAKKFVGNEAIMNRAIRLMAEENVQADEVLEVLRQESRSKGEAKSGKRVRGWV
jgi:hypothetical protein